MSTTTYLLVYCLAFIDYHTHVEGADVYIGYAPQYTILTSVNNVYVQKCPRSFGIVKTNDSFYPAYGGYCRVNSYMSRCVCNYVSSGYCNGNGADDASPRYGCGYVHCASGQPSNNQFSQGAYCPTGTPYNTVSLSNWNMVTGYGSGNSYTTTVKYNKETGIFSLSVGIPDMSRNGAYISTRIINHCK